MSALTNVSIQLEIDTAAAVAVVERVIGMLRRGEVRPEDIDAEAFADGVIMAALNITCDEDEPEREVN